MCVCVCVLCVCVCACVCMVCVCECVVCVSNNHFIYQKGVYKHHFEREMFVDKTVQDGNTSVKSYSP